MDAPPVAKRRPVAWSIAGTDSGGGAGLQADTRAFDACGVHAACAVAAITAQHSRGVLRVDVVAPDVLDAQLAALADDMPPDAIKTGLLGSIENLRVVARWVTRLRAARPGRPVPLVVDPVFGATTGAAFADDALRAAYRDELLPLATLASPNLREACALAAPSARHDPVTLARAWRAFGPRAVVVTGGDVDVDATCPLRHERQAAGAHDWLDSDHGLPVRGWLGLPRIATPHHHGTGCTFASAAAAALAHGFVAADSAVLAKMATHEALRAAYPAGAGAGPVSPRAGFERRPANLPTLSPAPMPASPDDAYAELPPDARGLYAIVDDAERVGRVLEGGVRLVQLRIKAAPTDALVREIRAAIALARRAHATLFVNDHWRLALELGADGVHLGQQDLEDADLDALREAGLMLGVSTHSAWEVCRARALRPSYVACGPIHETALKKMPWTPQGDGNLAAWCRLLAGTPVVAIGGMDPARARDAMRAGARAVAVVGAIPRATDPAPAIAALHAAIAEGSVEDAAEAGPACVAADTGLFFRSTLGA